MYYRNPDPRKAHITIFYRSVQAKAGDVYSPVGLGVNAMLTSRVLRGLGVRCDPVGVWTVHQIDEYMRGRGASTTHAIIEAPWVSAADMLNLMARYPDAHWVVRVHSTFGFLQVEAGTVALIRRLLTMQDQGLNLSLAGNLRSFCKAVQVVLQSTCLYLPNLYEVVFDGGGTFMQDRRHRAIRSLGMPLRIASFGAVRLLKNHLTAAAAALVISQRRGSDLEFRMTLDKNTPGGSSVVLAVQNLFANIPSARMIVLDWQDWGLFKQVVASQDLCMQLSASETFNLVSADACSSMVPIVTGPAVEWVPPSYQVRNIDDPNEAATVGSALLSDPNAGLAGYEALAEYGIQAEKVWLDWLHGSPHYQVAKRKPLPVLD